MAKNGRPSFGFLVFIGFSISRMGFAQDTSLLNWFDSYKSGQTALHEIMENDAIKKNLEDPTLSSLTMIQKVNGPTNVETTKFQHYYKGLEVIGSQAIHHHTEQGTFIRNRMAIFDLDTHPTLNAKIAGSIAQGAMANADIKTEPVLKILPASNQDSARLIYWVQLEGKSWDGDQDILLDAHSGQIIAALPRSYSIAPIQIYSARNQGKKITPHMELDPVSGKSKVKDCKLEDIKLQTSKSIDLLSCKEVYGGTSIISKGQCQVIDGQSGSPLDVNAGSCKSIVSHNTILDRTDPAAKKASDNSIQVLNYYRDHLNRDSFDNRGSDVVSVIHAGEKMGNAFWIVDLNTMVYGDGDGITMGDLTSAVDVAGHEMTHGVTEQTAKLLMMNESGALNEAFSDYFGKLIEGQGRWTIGETLFVGSNAAKGIRNLANPGSIKSTIKDDLGRPVEKAYPSKLSEAAIVSRGEKCASSNDHCWVHFNSTIPSHASYLVHQALGPKKSEILYYTALTQNLTATDDFKSAAKAIVETCSHLNYTTADCTSVKRIYTQAGILN